MAVASHQQALSWNGNEWVQTSGHVGSSTHSTYSSTGSQVNDAYSNNDDNPVFRYTKYYHDWKAREAEEERKMNTLPEGNLKQEAKRNRQLLLKQKMILRSHPLGISNATSIAV